MSWRQGAWKQTSAEKMRHWTQEGISGGRENETCFPQSTVFRKEQHRVGQCCISWGRRAQVYLAHRSLTFFHLHLTTYHIISYPYSELLQPDSISLPNLKTAPLLLDSLLSSARILQHVDFVRTRCFTAICQNARIKHTHCIPSGSASSPVVQCTSYTTVHGGWAGRVSCEQGRAATL